MSEEPAPQPPGSAGTAPFKMQIDSIHEVMAPVLRPAERTYAHVGKILQINPSGVTERCNGKRPLRIGDASRIIDGFGLAIYGLDHRIFEITDRNEFLNKLREHGVGIYEVNPRRRLIRLLGERRVDTGLTVGLRRARRERGIGGAEEEAPLTVVLHPGEPVEITLQATQGRYIALVQFRMDLTHVIEVLSPSIVMPLIEVEDRRFSLPGAGARPLIIRRTPVHYRLIAVEADEKTVTKFWDNDAAEARVLGGQTRMTDGIAKEINETLLLKSPGAVRTAWVDFIIA
ncbi:hypothetical protein XINFAN_01953 [Pseudogemmobacter humi]|uniref:Uncharacterized protein n=1 Tax=Pseudogemmobacter humi TaxID=2483812 RepID=A0A3P5X227_9RHOB|nr:hypothetical protein XINFAN_01953 [Pseudogemmobacter humi]